MEEDTSGSCEAQGGRLEIFVGSQQSYCNMPTGDAGQSCTTSSDCQSYCMAETMTCFGYETLGSGCHSYIHADGTRIDMCSD